MRKSTLRPQYQDQANMMEKGKRQPHHWSCSYIKTNAKLYYYKILFSQPVSLCNE